jgi:hypothetical protein
MAGALRTRCGSLARSDLPLTLRLLATRHPIVPPMAFQFAQRMGPLPQVSTDLGHQINAWLG